MDVVGRKGRRVVRRPRLSRLRPNCRLSPRTSGGESAHRAAAGAGRLQISGATTRRGNWRTRVATVSAKTSRALRAGRFGRPSRRALLETGRSTFRSRPSAGVGQTSSRAAGSSPPDNRGRGVAPSAKDKARKSTRFCSALRYRSSGPARASGFSSSESRLGPPYASPAGPARIFRRPNAPRAEGGDRKTQGSFARIVCHPRRVLPVIAVSRARRLLRSFELESNGEFSDEDFLDPEGRGQGTRLIVRRRF